MLIYSRQSTRCLIILTGLLISVAPTLAGGKTAPAVPGFARFHADAKANGAKGGHLLLGELNCISCHAPAGNDLVVRSAPEGVR